MEDDPTGGKLAAMTSHLNGAPNRLENIIQFHVGEIITSLQLTAMQPGGMEIVLYTTILGAIGILLPFQSRQDVDFFQHLEMHMRQENPPLCGRDHLMFRSYYFPAKDVVDGDLCEQFSMVSCRTQFSENQPNYYSHPLEYPTDGTLLFNKSLNILCFMCSCLWRSRRALQMSLTAHQEKFLRS